MPFSPQIEMHRSSAQPNGEGSVRETHPLGQYYSTTYNQLDKVEEFGMSPNLFSHILIYKPFTRYIRTRRTII